MGYWIRRFAKEEPASESEQDMVFVRLPSEQEAARKLLSEESSSVRIFISDSIRIEISDSCRPELMESILGFLQRHAWPGRRNNGISFLRSHWSEKKLQWSGRHHQIKISPRPILTLHVCVLQPSAYFYKDPPMGRIRILDTGSWWNGSTVMPSVGWILRTNSVKWPWKRSTGCVMDYP